MRVSGEPKTSLDGSKQGAYGLDANTNSGRGKPDYLASRNGMVVGEVTYFMKVLKRIAVLLFLLVTTTGLFAAWAVWKYPEKVVEGYNEIRPRLIRGGGEACLLDLKERGVEFRVLKEFGEGQCAVKTPVSVSRFSSTELSSPVVMNCRFATKVDDWLGQIGATKVEHFGTYNCRTIAGSGVLSEHSFGNAIDISSIDGASILKNWEDKDAKGTVLKSAAEQACRYFVNVLTPESNAAHADHLHLDAGLGFKCR